MERKEILKLFKKIDNKLIYLDDVIDIMTKYDIDYINKPRLMYTLLCLEQVGDYLKSTRNVKELECLYDVFLDELNDITIVHSRV